MKLHEIIIHWLNLICFCVLLVMGILLFIPRFPFLKGILTGSGLTKTLHHIVAIPFAIFLPFDCANLKFPHFWGLC